MGKENRQLVRQLVQVALMILQGKLQLLFEIFMGALITVMTQKHQAKHQSKNRGTS